MEYIILNGYDNNSGIIINCGMNMTPCPHNENPCHELCPLGGGGCGHFYPSIGLQGEKGLEPLTGI